MNNLFNPRRFLLLFKKTLSERPTQMFGFTGMILALTLIFYAICKALAGFGAAQNISFIWGLAGGGCFIASFVFSYFSSNASGSSYLTLPASSFEKWLCGILIAGILFPLIFVLYYKLMDTCFVTIYHNSLDPAGPYYKMEYDSVYFFPLTGRVAVKIYTLFLVFSGAMFVGSLYFNKGSFIKTTLIGCLLAIGTYALNWLIARIFFGNVSDAFPFRYVSLFAGKSEGSVELPAKLASFYAYSFNFIVPLVLWVTAYIRLREKEF